MKQRTDEVQTKTPHKCVNCGEEVWLGTFFKGNFLCSECLTEAADIIYRLKRKLRLLKRKIKAYEIEEASG